MRPKIVAELSGSHGGSLDNCLRLIDEAKRLRVDYIKFQCYSPIALAQRRKDRFPELDLVALYTRMQTPKTWWPRLMEHIGDYPWGVSVFSGRDLEFVLPHKPHFLKIASYELTDTNLIRACSKIKQPMIISVGPSATESDVVAAMEAANQWFANQWFPIFLLATHYWDSPDDWNSPKLSVSAEIDRYRWLSKILPPHIPIGLSDHMPPDRYALAVYAASKGAAIIERHLVLPDIHSDDAPFSSTPEQFRIYMDRIARFAGEGRGEAQRTAVEGG